tara:strand:+ start:13612 stop:15528 length:1917 start_codon:yes stop_codon:yes gene_type:complete
MTDNNNLYRPTHFRRLRTNEVVVGNIGIGGSNPIRIQSMTTTDTMNTRSSVDQSVKMIKKGCELIRLTAPSIKDAKNLYDIKNELLKRGFDVPLIADIHFTPNAAIEAAKIVEKVRINPGNYSDKKKFQIHNYSKTQYADELKRIEDKFTPLIKTCKKYKTAMRIGTNHGSLSDRIMSQYGDTPLGMVESALEFVRICEKEKFKQIILSMKASNPLVMIEAYRLLIKKMHQENMFYPIHLGVTEAGEGSHGRVKSAMGIGSLLMDGIGDTIRVSLTEPPEEEMPVAQHIIDHIKNVEINKQSTLKNYKDTVNIGGNTRKTNSVLNIGGNNHPIVISDISKKTTIRTTDLLPLGYRYSSKLDKWHISDRACDYIFIGNSVVDFEIPGTLGVVTNYKAWRFSKKGYPKLSIQDYLNNTDFSSKLNFLDIHVDTLDENILCKIRSDNTVVLWLNSKRLNTVYEYRKIINILQSQNIFNPVIISKDYNSINKDKVQIAASIDFGSLLLDGVGDGVSIFNSKLPPQFINNLLFDILQGSRKRISQTEYISCPSCGRTLFDLEETTAKIRRKTSHLKGLKIGVMGCIVNGPGEMADADYGYVGTGPDKVSLYKKQDMVKRNINTEDALDELVQLIKDNGDWLEA